MLLYNKEVSQQQSYQLLTNCASKIRIVHRKVASCHSNVTITVVRVLLHPVAILSIMVKRATVSEGAEDGRRNRISSLNAFTEEGSLHKIDLRALHLHSALIHLNLRLLHFDLFVFHKQVSQLGNIPIWVPYHLGHLVIWVNCLSGSHYREGNRNSYSISVFLG